MLNVNDVADFFIYASKTCEMEPMTNLRLQKMVYYAQAWCLQRTGEPLFADEIQAWDFGPVIPALYHKYKKYNKKPIPIPRNFSIKSVGDSFNLLMDVMTEYGQYTTAALVNKSHEKREPWAKVNKEKDDAVMPKLLIKDCFDNMEPLRSTTSYIDRIPSVGERNENGVLVLPGDMDDEI